MGQVDYGIVEFNGVRYPVLPTASYQNLARWNGKTVFGDYTRDSDEVISSKIWTAFGGGIGVLHNREGSDDGRCWWSTLWTQSPFQLTLNRRSVAVTGARYPLGDLANIFYVADANQVFPWDESTAAFGTALTGTMSTPVWKGTAWNGNQYIPLGDNGYAYHNGTAVTTSTAIDVVDFCAWDNRLIALGYDAKIYESFDGTSWAQVAEINSSETPKRLVVYTDRSDNEAVYVITDRVVYGYDPVLQLLIRTRLQFPPHPDNGLGAAVWRPGEDLYVSAGLGVYRFNLAAIAPTGLDRDEGLPTEYRGVIKDLEPGHNMLVAYLQGQQTASEVADPQAEFDVGQNTEEMALAGSDAYSLLVAWNGFGWHPLWISPDAEGDPVWCVFSGAENVYRLWWGYGVDSDNRCYTQLLPRSFANPRQLIDAGEGDFTASGQLDTGWFDANMREFDKVASHLEFNVETASATETITVSYMRDYDTSWTLLGNITASGKAIIPLNVGTYDGNDFSYGLNFRRIRFLVQMSRDPSDSTVAPLLDSFVLKYIKVPIATATYQLSIPLDFEEWEGRGPDAIKAELDTLIESNQFIAFHHGDPNHSVHRVRLSYVRGVDSTGQDYRGRRDITVVEVPLEGYEGRGS